MQIVFLDSSSPLNPRTKTGQIICEGLRIHGIARGSDLDQRVIHLLELVGLPSAAIERYSHQRPALGQSTQGRCRLQKKPYQEK